MSLSIQPVRVATSSPDENGLLVFDSDQKLVALLVQLSDEHESQAGRWFYEAGFGPMDGPDHPTFADLDVAQEWITKRMARMRQAREPRP